jgi:hypothetical protein
VGNSLDKTDYQRMEDWVERMDKWIKKLVKEFHFWLHQPDNVSKQQKWRFSYSKN